MSALHNFIKNFNKPFVDDGMWWVKMERLEKQLAVEQDLSLKDDQGRTALAALIEDEQHGYTSFLESTIRLLVANGAPLFDEEHSAVDQFLSKHENSDEGVSSALANALLLGQIQAVPTHGIQTDADGRNLLHVFAHQAPWLLRSICSKKLSESEGTTFNTMIQQKDHHGDTPLHRLFAEHGWIETPQLDTRQVAHSTTYSKLGVTRDAINDAGQTPTDLLADRLEHNEEIVRGQLAVAASADLMLEMALVEIDRRNLDRQTPLAQGQANRVAGPRL